ncbi:unnamed protein product [Adineta steineri]|uniref:Nucleolar protein 10 n=1 Tax=Adineta steineri TaxID=433720 RepID=A0A815B909_9BILA|nr:unnamed protein product [Adineta steineri]
METLCSMLLGPKGNFGFNFVGRPDKNSKNEMRIHSRHLNDYMAVTCLQPGRVYSCPADNCTVVGFVRAETDYPSDCYVLRKPIQFTVTEHARWYHFNLPSGKSGYVNTFFCEGVVPHFKKMSKSKVDAENIFAKFLEATKLDLQNGYTGPTEFSTASDGDREKGERVYTFKKVDPAGNPTLSAHPAKFSPDDQYSRQRLKLKTRYRLLLTQTPLTKC